MNVVLNFFIPTIQRLSQVGIRSIVTGMMLIFLLPAFVRPAGAEDPLISISTKLETRSDFQFANQSLADVLRSLADRIQVSIVLDQAALQRQWLDVEAIDCTWQSSDSTAKEVLDQVLAVHQLAWMIRHNVIWITTPSAAQDDFLETRIYRVTQPISVERRARSIRATVERDSWNVVGGPGDLSPMEPHFIAVRQTPSIHRKIANVFRKSVELVQQTVTIDFGPDAAESSETTAAIKVALQETVDVRCQSSPVFEVIKSLGSSAGCEVVIDEEALRETLISEPLLLSLEIHRVPLASAISLVLASAHSDWCWTVSGDRLTVTTTRQIDRIPLKRNYDLRSIIGHVNQDRLIEAIEYTVHPKTWQFGGGEGTMEMSTDGVLTVQQTRSVHASLRRFLQDLQTGVATLPADGLRSEGN